MTGARRTTKRTRKSPQDLLDGVKERLDATPERLARAKEAGQTPTRDADRTRRILDPFDTMRANRVLAPHDPKLNDIRWLVGESLRRTHARARLDQLRAVALDRVGGSGFGPRPGLPQSEIALHARDKLRAAEDRVGPHAWPIVTASSSKGRACATAAASSPNSPPPGEPTTSCPTACGSRSICSAGSWASRRGGGREPRRGDRCKPVL